jgi:hypothetical protein
MKQICNFNELAFLYHKGNDAFLFLLPETFGDEFPNGIYDVPLDIYSALF